MRIFKRSAAGIAAITIVFALTACQPAKHDEAQQTQTTEAAENAASASVEDSTIKKLYEHRTEYVGSNSEVGAILDLLELPENGTRESFELKTDQEPYEITINYSIDKINENPDVNDTTLDDYNAAILFSLIKNVESVNMEYAYLDSFASAGVYERESANTRFEGDLWEQSSDEKGFDIVVTKLMQMRADDSAAVKEEIKALNNNIAYNKYKGLSYEQIASAAKALPLTDAFKDANEITTAGSGTWQSISSEIIKARDDATYEDLLSQFENPNNTVDFRSSIVQEYLGRSAADGTVIDKTASLKKYLNDPNMDIEIKSILLILGGFPKEDVPMLEKVLNDNAKNGDVRLAVFAFDALENTDASSANAIAQNIIEKRKDYNSAVVMAAFGAISESLMANPSTEETDKYLKLCDELLKEYPDKNIKLAMLSSVSGVGTMETVNYAIDNANNEVYKKVFVEMNSSLITTILSHDSASSDDVDFIVKCMEIYPLPEFENQLTAFLDKTTDEADKQKLNAAIKAVKSAEPSPPEN